MPEDPSIPTDEECAKGSRDWPHAPPHRLASAGVYFVTARSAEQRHLLSGDDMRDYFQETLFSVAAEFGWTLEAWAVLSNHYHFVGHSPATTEGAAASLGPMLRKDDHEFQV